MKKVLLAAAVMATAFTGSAQKWAVVGSYSDPAWTFDASTVFESKGDGVFECEIAKLTDGFKIVDIATGDWSIQYGAPSSADLLEVGEPFYLATSDNAPNINYANMVSYVENAKLKLVMTEAEQTLTITGNAVREVPELYVTGSFCGWSDPGQDGAVKLTENNGVYTGTVNFGEVPAGAVEGAAGYITFKIAATGWAPQFAWTKGEEGGVSVAGEAYTLNRDGDDIKLYFGGEQTVTFTYDTLELVVGGGAGVEGVEVADEAPVYFNLQGVQVANPEQGIYIVKRGAKVAKEVIR